MTNVTELPEQNKQESVFQEIESGKVKPGGAKSAVGLAGLPQANIDPSTTNLLVQVLTLMAGKEARDLQKQEQELKNQKQRDEKRAQNAKGQEYERISKQARCKHRKGGTQVKDSRLDYNVGTHVYPDGTTIITCLTCHAKWRKGDTKEYFLRKGRKISNHTHIGWAEAVGMYQQSTNTITKSEIDPKALYENAASKPKEGSYELIQVDNQIRDIDGKVVENFEL